MSVYWKYFKKDDKFYIVSKIAKDTVREDETVIEQYGMASGLTIDHILTYQNRVIKYRSFCGYDRGPKKQMKLRKAYFGTV